MNSQPTPQPGLSPVGVPPGWAHRVAHAIQSAEHVRAAGSAAHVQATAHLDAATAIETAELDPIHDTDWTHGWREQLPDWLQAVLSAAAAHHRTMARRLAETEMKPLPPEPRPPWEHRPTA